ncbi:primosomal protein N' [Saccharibacillus deserti]|uniref:primosomal protein N' n=1 Tax=Saccharibacillus deserti TaxID=1634444 RepID=UPI001552A2A1|nr:primosomal protein N' [Saccharibacillus deserti]
MNFARVIVDVPVRAVSRPFDYRIPPEMQEWIAVGSRVGVPFGGRTVQGFVVGLSDESEYKHGRIKAIRELLDLVPPLPEDLVELGSWIADKYACHKSTALQLMIPAALKGKAERFIHAVRKPEGEEEEQEIGRLIEELPEDGGELSLFGGSSAVDVSSAREILEYVRNRGQVKAEQLRQSFPGREKAVQALIKGGLLFESQEIRDRMGRKTVKTVVVNVDAQRAAEELEHFPARAKKQKEIFAFLVELGIPMPQKEVLSVLGVTASAIKSLEDKGLVRLEDVEVFRDPYEGRDFKPSIAPKLTDEQQQVYDAVIQRLNARREGVFLLHGITGSGKTEVYLQSIERCIAQQRQAIVLVPEISLTPQMVERFKSRFGSKVAVMHSRLSGGERYDEWRKIREGRVQVAIGARSAIFAPFKDIGLIVMDEEHESSYKQEESPKYHARNVAVKRAEQHNAVVILGSATPSLETYHAARSQSDPHFSPILTEISLRALGSSLPGVNIIDMREELKEGNRSMFSRDLHKAIEQRLERGEQTVLLLNRRGYSTFVMCRTCGYVAECPNCDISLTYHQRSNNLRCHYCGHAETVPETCPECGSEHIRYFGTGTQRVEEELAKLFPAIRVVRMDVDTTSEKGSHEKLLQKFRDKKADVLLGTQMVAKGLDFPDVTLVGVIAADSALNLPDFRAGEKTFQLLTQVAGRAGRHHLPGEVFIQSYNPEHYSIIHASKHDYHSFVREELGHRRKLGYPPYCRLILVTFSHEQLPVVVRMAENYAAMVKEKAQARGWLARMDKLAPNVLDLLGPIASPIPRIKNRYRFQCMIKWRGEMDAALLAREIADELEDTAKEQELLISIDVDPQVMM